MFKKILFDLRLGITTGLESPHCKLPINCNRKTLLLKSAFLIFILIFGYKVQAQQVFELIPDSSVMTVKGISSLHDWEMKVEKVDCKLTAETGNKLLSIKELQLTVASKSIKADQSLMNKKAQNALKSDKYPQITFNLLSAVKVGMTNETFSGTATGELKLAGITKKINLQFSGKYSGNKKLQIKGSQKINMTDFGIQPPTAMLGALKTGKEITVTYILNFKQL